MPRTLACCPLQSGVQGRHQGHSLVVQVKKNLNIIRMQLPTIKPRPGFESLLVHLPADTRARR